MRGVRTTKPTSGALNFFSLVIGLAISVGGLLPYDHSEMAYGFFHPLFMLLAGLFMPGLMLSAVFGGNIHNISLFLAVVINWLLYTGWLFLVARKVGARKTKVRDFSS